MAESEERLSFILILLFSLLFIVLYFIYIALVFQYIIDKLSTKKISMYWIQYIISCTLGVLFFFIYLCYLMKTKGERLNPFNEEESSGLFIFLVILLVTNVYNIINNLVYDIIVTLFLSFNLYKTIGLDTLDLEELRLKIRYIKRNTFNFKQYILYWTIFVTIDIILIVIFAIEYKNYNDENTTKIFQVKNYILYLIKYSYFICFLILIISLFIMNFFRTKLFLKSYYNKDKFAMKIYNINYCQIIYNSDIILYKISADLLINSTVIIFTLFKACNSFLIIVCEICFFLYILLLGALYFKIDKNNEVGKISKNIKCWYALKNFHFYFGFSDHKTFINENTYKYSKEEKETLKRLNLDKYDLIIDNNINEENKNIKNGEDTELEVQDKNKDNLNLRKSKSKKKNLNFETNSELYILYKLLMLYFEINENIFLNVESKINEDGTPFKQFFVEQNISKTKKVKARQTFGGTDAILRKNNFIANIDRISRISKMNSFSIIPSKKFPENQIFFSLEEKELKEEFKKKYNLSKKETTFKIEALSANAFFELFPFYQISIQDIKKALNPSDNKKIYNIILKRNKDNINKSNNTSNINKNETDNKTENNLFYTYNSLLMMEIYEPEEFISFNELQKFTLSYGSYLLDTIKNINFTFIPLILGIFNIEICGENKVVILYRNPLFFTNSSHFNHWINFCITEGPERLKVSILQNDVIDVNEIEIKNSLKMNETDYDEIINNIKKDFNFFMKMNIQVYPIINLFIGDENGGGGGIIGNNNDANESSLMGDTSLQQNNLSGLLNNLEEGGFNNNISNSGKDKNNIEEDLYETETNSLVDKEYYSMTGNDIHTLKIYFTHFFRLDCELNKQNDKNDNMILKSNHYCQYLEGQLQTYLTKTTLFELDNNENN